MVAQQAVILPAPPQPTDQWSRDYANQLYRWMESFQRQVTGFPYLRGSGLFFPENALPTAEAGLTPGEVYVLGGALFVAGGGGSVNEHLAELAAIDPTDGQFIVGDGMGWVGESGATARTSLGLGTAALTTYEEDLFTPTLDFGGAAAGLTYATQSGRYTKIGRVVVVQLRIILSAKGSSTGTAVIRSLPFAQANTAASCAISYYASMSLTGPLAGNLGTNSDAITLRQFNGSTGTVPINDTNFTDTTDIAITVVYQAAS